LGFRFSTYALHWINQAIGKSNEADALIALPHQVRQLVSWERKVREKLTREQGIEPGEEEVIARMELSAREEEALRRGKRAFIDSSRTTAESSEIDFMESLPGDPGVEIQRLDAAEARSRVGRALERLFEGKFRTVMERRFSSVGSEGRSGRPSTLAAIGKDLSLCRERISQLERAGVELLTNYFIVETALPSVRAKVQQRVLGPEDEKVMINLIGAHYEELCDKRRQAEVLQRSAAGVVIVELGEAGWKTLASARGLAPARAFVVGDRLFGREPCFFEVARRAVSTGMVTDKWFNATDAETLFFRTLRQMGPALREEFRRRRSQLF
jgi:DNA-directed RNA polymerase specialized sigma subunit